ncbi:MAG TPA: hypothetical protein VG738_18025 [Chitinophagaceae bacterium]|nr:hypothetical protein [Chitinophagaceae bacterium]
MKKVFVLAVSCLQFVLLFGQAPDSLNTEKNLRDKILGDIQSSLDKKSASFDSTITHINSRVDNLDSVIKTTTSVKEKADKLAERVQVLESKQKAEEENELNIYQANYQSAVVNLVSMDREIKPLLLFDVSRQFFSDLNQAGNPMNYAGYKEWFNKFNKYVKDNKSDESLLTVTNNLLTFSGGTAQYVPVVGPVSSVLFAGMSTYVTSLGKRQRALREESEKMITLTMKVSQFDYDKGEIEHEWELITDELMNLKNLYARSLHSNLAMLKTDSTEFNENFSNESDAEKRYQYLTAIRQKASDYVEAQKTGAPKDWKEAVYNQMMQVQSLKMRFGQITFRINENIIKYGGLFEKYKNDAEIGVKMTDLEAKLQQLKEIFDKAFDPLDYINSATRMYKVA